MEHSKFIVDVSLRRGLGFGNPKKDDGNPFYPFREVIFEFHEIRICPFCGKELGTSSYNCDCQKFEEAFEKMQRSFMDYEQKLEFHEDLFNVSSYAYSVSDVSCRLLDEQEVSELGPDFWDNADRTKHSPFTKKTYLLSKGAYDGQKVTFYCKDIETKQVWLCKCEDKLDYAKRSILLGKYYSTFVPNGFGDPNALGNYHEEFGYNDIRRFSGWNQVCKELKTFWFLLRRTSLIIIF